jgi:hypothetical protein
MRLSTRQSVILLQIEESLSPESLPSNPLLVSQVLPGNLLPIPALYAQPALLKLKAADYEVIQCCMHSKFVEVVSHSGFLVLKLRYTVIPSTLFVKKFTEETSELQRFITGIHGNSNFRVVKVGDGFFRVNFDQTVDAIAVWRAIKIIPFGGHRLEVTALAILPEEQTPPIPVVPKIVVEPRSKSPAKIGLRAGSGNN